MTKLYHKDVFMPEEVRAIVRRSRLALKWSRHARAAFLNDRYGLHALGRPPVELDCSGCELVEAEVDAGRLVKMVLRHSFSASMDLVLVVHPDGFVRTVWGNEKRDVHRSLDRARYANR